VSKITKAAHALMHADRKFTHRAAAQRDTPAVKLLGGLSEVADQPPLILLGIGTIVAGAALRRPVVVRTGVRILASELLATKLKSLIKHSVDRTRPAKAIETGKHDFAPGHDHDTDENAFPSGHTAGAVAVAGAVAQDYPAAAVPAYGLATAIAAVQMPRGKHYVLDTLVGAALGLVAQKVTTELIGILEPALVTAIRGQKS
jgi:membrane-associated phospholipid phosphatase